MRNQAKLYCGGSALAALLLLSGCHKVDSAAGTDAGDPAAANLAPVNGQADASLPGSGYAQSGNVPAASSYGAPAPGASGAAQPYRTEAGMPPAPPEDAPQTAEAAGAGSNTQYADQYADPQGYSAAGYGSQGDNQGGYGTVYNADYDQTAYAEQPPPPLPDYGQPPCPGDNYIWTPGYWNYAPAGYFWVPGVWVAAPFFGALWTPGYWGFESGRYGFHHGYWGRHIGFYGGIAYGYGYFGHGYEGGYWNGNRFFYNSAVTRINTTYVHNTYIHNVTVVNNYGRAAYDGGRGGLSARPAAYEIAAAREQHFGALPAQQQHVEQARADRTQFAGANGARPQQLTVGRPLAGRTAASPVAANLHPVTTQGGWERSGRVNVEPAPRVQAEQGRALNNPAGANGSFARSQQAQQQAVAAQSRAIENQGRAQQGQQNEVHSVAGNSQAAANLDRQRAAEQTRQAAQENQIHAQAQQARARQGSQQAEVQRAQQAQQQAREQQGHAMQQQAEQQARQPQIEQPRTQPAPQARPQEPTRPPEQPRPEPSRPEPSHAAPEAPHGGGGDHGHR